MQSENRIFDDLAKMMTGVAGTMAGMGREAEASIRERAREWTGGLDLVSREEFDAVKAMAAKAREEADTLAKRVAALEAKLGTTTKAVPRGKVKKPAPSKAKASSPAKDNAAPRFAANKPAMKPTPRKK